VTQLKDARGDLQIESFPKGARSGTTTTLASLREDRAIVIDSQGRDPARFRITARTPMGVGRKAGTRSPGFIDSFLGLLTDFYAGVVQNITAWQPKAPQLKREVIQEAALTPEHDAVPLHPLRKRH
jgi:hypothetical protein